MRQHNFKADTKKPGPHSANISLLTWKNHHKTILRFGRKLQLVDCRRPATRSKFVYLKNRNDLLYVKYQAVAENPIAALAQILLLPFCFCQPRALPEPSPFPYHFLPLFTVRLQQQDRNLLSNHCWTDFLVGLFSQDCITTKFTYVGTSSSPL